jgi:RNA polymerase sigma-70 factor (ECF subfamily)
MDVTLERTLLDHDLTASGTASDETAAPDAALERAVIAHSRFVYRVAFAVLRNQQEAEDATQEVFLRVLRLKRELSGVSNPRSWLGRIAFRVAIDRRPRPVTLSIHDDSLAASVASLRASGASVDDVASSNEVQALLGEAIEALPEDLRRTIQLSTLQELNSSEIAFVMGIPEGTVRTRLLRARKLLKAALTPVLGRNS